VILGLRNREGLLKADLLSVSIDRRSRRRSIVLVLRRRLAIFWFSIFLSWIVGAGSSCAAAVVVGCFTAGRHIILERKIWSVEMG
jgi:hypothetical protein